MMRVKSKQLGGLAAGLVAGLLLAPSAQAVTVGVGPGTDPWLGFMNVSELPANGGAYLWGSAWGVPDLTATFNDVAQTVTLGPNTIADADPYWYIGGGGPGAAGNKIMEANLYYEVTDVYNGQTVTFEGTVLSNTLTAAHDTVIFIKDFAPDYSSFNVSSIPAAVGPFSLSLATDPGAGRHVQWGFTTTGVNVWSTDVAQYGTVVIGTIPEPATLSLLGLGGLAIAGRRRA